jgi:hypothetical protein
LSGNRIVVTPQDIARYKENLSLVIKQAPRVGEVVIVASATLFCLDLAGETRKVTHQINPRDLLRLAAMTSHITLKKALPYYVDFKR